MPITLYDGFLLPLLRAFIIYIILSKQNRPKAILGFLYVRKHCIRISKPLCSRKETPRGLVSRSACGFGLPLLLTRFHVLPMSSYRYRRIMDRLSVVIPSVIRSTLKRRHEAMTMKINTPQYRPAKSASSSASSSTSSSVARSDGNLSSDKFEEAGSYDPVLQALARQVLVQLD
ncbi:hypothetical protein KP509_37G007800 [Ceratopteris richardii]|uniref:Uncharacterized protein n=1 Tax=Ceratopteris richardii TaxID=49495 RepID=A0A8T2Q675_CERRI|nr:hypothetical protein KP509_37G007800 [Ceratopteris richardii]